MLAWAVVVILPALASVPAHAQYKYRRSITVDRTKVRNPALFPIAFDNVSSAKTADGGATNLSWNHTVGSGAERLAVVSVSSVPTAVTITADGGTSQGGAGVSSMTFTNYTVPAGNNKALIVSVCIRNNALQTVTSVTYGSTPLSFIGVSQNTTNVRVELWGLLNVTPGSANLVVTLSASANFIVGVVPFSNVGSIASDRVATARTTGTTASVDVTSAPGEVVVDAMANIVTTAGGAPTATIGAGQTANWSTVYVPSQVRGSGSREAGASPTVTMSWTLSASVAWAIAAVPLTPAVVTQVMFGATDITANEIGTATNSGNCAVSMYYMLNPPSGDNTVSVTTSASTRFVAGATTLANVDQTTPFGTFASAVGSGQGTWAADVAIPSSSGEIVVAALAKRYNYAVRPEQSTHQADRWQLATGLGTSEDILGVGTLRGGEAGAQAYWALSGGSTWQEWAIGGVPVKPTTVAPAQITTLSNYPLLVSLSHASLKSVANGGHVQNANGYDIVFRASDGITQLDHELEKYDGVNGQVVAWVRLPSVNGAGASSDTQLYVYYGNPGISSPTQNKTAVWDANYMEVWHLAEPSGNAIDSTSNGYTATIQGTGTPTRPAAKIDGGFGFAGDSWLQTNDGQFTTANAPFTIESWFYIASGSPTWVGIATKNRNVSCDDNPPYCDWAGVWIGGAGELTYAWDWHNQGNMEGGAALSTGTWYYGAIVFDGGMRTGYRNGARDTVITSPNPAPGIYTDLVMPTRINKDLDGGGMLTGTIDEVRVSTVARTPGWILTTYDNMNDPGNIGTPGFYSVGDEAELGAGAQGMKQLIIGGNTDALSNSQTEYNTIAGGQAWNLFAAQRKQVVSTAGTLNNLFVELSQGPGVGTSYTITVMINDAPTSLAVTVVGVTTTGSNTTESISVAAGDTIQLRSTYSGTPMYTPSARWSVMFEGSYAKESLILGVGTTSTTANRFVPISHGTNQASATENQTYQVIPTSGTIKDLHVALSVDPGNSPAAYRFTLRKNGASTALTVTITADDTTGSDTTNQVTVAAGDYVDMMIEPLNSPATVTIPWWGMTFVADTDGESLILGQSSDAPTLGSTEYNHLSSTVLNGLWDTTESYRYQGGQSGATLKKLHVRLSGASSNTYTLYLRATGAGGNTPLSVTIPAGQTTGNDVANTYAVGDYDDLDISLNATGTAQMVYWGLVSYIAPAAVPGAGLGPLIAYSPNAAAVNNQLYYSLYSGSGWTIGAYAVSDSSDRDQYWKSARTHPNSSKQAVTWRTSSATGAARFFTSFWDGANWDDGTGAPYGDAYSFGSTPSRDNDYRGIDTAFEQGSGELLVAYSTNNTNNIRRFVWTGTSWSTWSDYTLPCNNSLWRWVKLAPKPDSNQIALIASADNGYVSMAIWNGDTNAWGNNSNGTAGSGSVTTDAIDIQYVWGGASAGDIVAVWWQGQYLYRQIYRNNLGSWDSSTPVVDLGSGNLGKWLRLKANPRSDDLVLAYGATVGGLYSVYTIPYDGDSRSWGFPSTVHTTAAYVAGASFDNNRPLDVVWDLASGVDRVLLVYSETSGIRYRTGTQPTSPAQWPPTWSGQLTITTSNQAYWVQLDRTPNGSVHLAVHDNADDLRTWTWVPSTWTAKNTITTDLEAGPSNHSVEAFALSTSPLSAGQYTYRRRITIPDSLTPSSCTSDLTSFPVLVSITDATLKSASNGGNVQSEVGNDIIFRGADEVTWLDHEIEKYDPTTGQLVAWVRIPTLAYDDDTIIYMYYGSPAVLSPTENPTGVWSNGYAAVYHLNGNANDSTGNHDGTVSGATSTTNGKIAGAYEFSGSNQFINTNLEALWGCGDFSIEVWWNADALWGVVVGVDEGVTGGGDTTHAACRIQTAMAGSVHQVFIHTEGTNGGNEEDDYVSAIGLSTGTWYHTALRRPPSADCKSCIEGFLNGGAMQGLPCQTLWGQTNFSEDFNIGRVGGSPYDGQRGYFNGRIDEVRFSNVDRDACWLGATSNGASEPPVIDPEQPTSAYLYERPITIPDLVPSGCGADLLDFPVLVSIASDDSLKSVTNGGKVESDAGWDIVFKSPDGKTQFDHEIEKYVAATGQLVAWVRIPTLPWDQSTTIYMHYGNPDIASPTANPAGVWSNGFTAVYHLNQTSGNQLNSTSTSGLDLTSLTLTAQGSAAGAVNGGDSLDGSDDHADTAATSVFNVADGDSLTVEAWVDTTDSSGFVVNRKNDDLPSDGTPSWQLWINGGSGAFWFSDVDGNNAWANGTTAVNDDSLHYLVGRWDGPSNTAAVFIDGSATADYETQNSSVGANTDTEPLVIGEEHDSNRGFNFGGVVDEVRVSSVARDVCWMGATYNSITSAGSVGSERPVFTFERPITISNSITPDGLCTSDLQDFPVVVSLTDVTLKTVANGGHVENVNGYDIAFFDETGIVQLDHEVEKYVPTTGELAAWVRIPTLAYDADTTILMQYGSAGVTSPTANPSGVWNSGYVGVWHLKETSGQHADSTGNNPSTSVTVATQGSAAGKIDGADDFNGTGNNVVVGDSATLDLTSAITITAWIDPDSLTGKHRVVVKDAAAGSESYVLRAYNGPDLEGYLSEGGTFRYARKANILSTSGYQHVALTWDGGSADKLLRLYYSGLEVSGYAVQDTAAYITPSADSLYFGSHDAMGELFDGRIDEIRVSNVARDACWIATEYGSMTSLPLGGGEGGGYGPTAISLVSLGATSYPGEGVLVAWQTGWEVDNLGFHVYREQGGERVRVTSGLVAGSALLAGAGTELGAGSSYGWWDQASSGAGSAVYWLEEWELDGTRRWHGPVNVETALPGDPAPRVRRSTRLSGLGAAEPGLLREGPVTDAEESSRGGSLSASSAGSHLQSGSASAVNGVSRLTPRRRLEQAERQFAVAGASVLKLGIERSGWVRISRDELVAAGLDPSVDPRSIQLFADGQEVPIRVTGEEDGVFGSSDALEWYGQGLDTPSTDTRVYYLVAGRNWGERIEVVPGGGSEGGGPASFPYEIVREDAGIYFASLKNGELDNFFGPVLSTEPVSQQFAIHHLDASGEAELDVRLQGASTGWHRVGVSLNGTYLGRIEWQGQEVGESRLYVPAGVIKEPATTVSFEPLGGEGDVSLIDRVVLRYAHTYQADDWVLTCTVPGGTGVQLGSFWKGPVRVVDVTNPGRPVELAGPYQGNSFGLTAPGYGTRTIVASSADWMAKPAWIKAEKPSALWASEGADLIVIAPAAFLPAVAPLVELRRSEGLTVLTADIEDVVDEFAAGAWGPGALQAFLHHATTEWHHTPSYVLLVGDSTLDPRDYLGFGVKDLVPTVMVETAYLETASDTALADPDGDGLTDLAIGRLPVRSLSEAQAVIAKLVRYERQAAGSTVVLVADANDEENDFEGATRTVLWAMPRTLTYKMFQRGFLGAEKVRTLLYEELQRGPMLVNYLGHGSVQQWAGAMLHVDDVRWLSSNRLTVVLTMTCLDGYFADPSLDSLGEALLAANGGAAAVWASTGLTEMAPQAVMNLALVEQLFRTSPAPRLGDAIRAALATTEDPDIRATWVLFGDPTMRVR